MFPPLYLRESAASMGRFEETLSGHNERVAKIKATLADPLSQIKRYHYPSHLIWRPESVIEDRPFQAAANYHALEVLKLYPCLASRNSPELQFPPTLLEYSEKAMQSTMVASLYKKIAEIIPTIPMNESKKTEVLGQVARGVAITDQAAEKDRALLKEEVAKMVKSRRPAYLPRVSSEQLHAAKDMDQRFEPYVESKMPSPEAIEKALKFCSLFNEKEAGSGEWQDIVSSAPSEKGPNLRR